ncbi:TetR/AcrR family transcriptional regulator [Intestinibacter sp.]|uniref:TetR/AcrR family transcriptional regulator n=1 Tax=Intestinibacter sp. TaxID=1965304 RepID=UPI003F13FE7B
MYQGDNKIALASQKHIAETLVNMLKIKEYSEISISQLCKEANVSRQTFYSLFQSKENVISYEIKNNYPFILDNEKENLNLENLCHNFAIYVNQNSSFLKKIVESNLSQIIYDCFYQSILSCNRIIPAQYNNKKRSIAAFLAGGLCSLVIDFANNDEEVCQKNLKETAYLLLSGTVFNKEV